MTSTSATTNSVFQAFIEAQHALEQLPAVEQELASTKAELDTTHHALDDAELRAMQLEDDLKALRATLAAKEEALAAATFREGEMAGKLAVIQSVIGVRQPEPVVVHSEPPVNVDRGEAASTNEYGDTHVAATAASTQHHDAEGTHAGSHGDVSTAAEGQSEAGPTRQSDGVQSTSGSSQSAHSDASHSATSINAPYWQKPATTSWRDWVAAGNQPAPWLGKDFFDPHTVAAK